MIPISALNRGTAFSAKLCRVAPLDVHHTWRPSSFKKWGEVFGDPVVAAALLDRLLHHAVVIEIEGNSYRLRQHAELIPDNLKPPMRPAQAVAQPRRGRPSKMEVNRSTAG